MIHQHVARGCDEVLASEIDRIVCEPRLDRHPDAPQTAI